MDENKPVNKEKHTEPHLFDFIYAQVRKHVDYMGGEDDVSKILEAKGKTETRDSFLKRLDLYIVFLDGLRKQAEELKNQYADASNQP